MTNAPVPGRLVAIYTAPAAGAPMVGRASVYAHAGRGLDGDRYLANAGTWSDREGSGRHVTLLAREDVAAVTSAAGLDVDEAALRRNLVTEGVDLDDLRDRTFRVGEVVLRGCRRAEPCSYLEGLTAPGVRVAFRHRAGLRAEVLTGGVLRVGDRIGEIEEAEHPARG
jgi:MOSC domain-containing protein YiiM